MSNPISQAVMKKSRPIKRAEAGVPTGLLDAYTEVPGTKEGMSDSEKFKEGYKKKGKGKVKNPPKKVEEAAEEVEEVEDDGVGESWDDDVVESWDQIDVEEMPVPVKVKKEMRKEEKKRKKDLEKAAKAQDAASEAADNAAESSAAPPEVKTQPSAVAAKVEPPPAETEKVTDAVKNLSIADDSKPAAGSGGPKELTAEEKAAVKADREAKKAEKAKRREEAKLKKSADPASAADSGEKPVAAAGKVEEAASKAPAPPKTSGAPGSKEAEGEKKTTTKAERRAKQEEQRKKKAEAGKGGETKSKENAKVRVPDEVKADDKKTEKKLAKTLISQKVPARTPAQRQIPLFSHLHQYERETSVTKDLPVAGGNLHPAVVQLGLQYAQGEVTGSSERCVALLTALRSLLQDLLPTLTPGPELYRDIDNLIKPNITFLKQCRPLSISMQNAIRYLKRDIKSLDKDLTMDQARESIVEMIDDFININFVLHPKAISATANRKISDNDVILTFSHSKLVERILVDAAAEGKRPRVIVAEARSPGLPAQAAARSLAVRLTEAGIHTTFLLVTALDLVMPEVTLVLLGCEGVMANGCVLATVGTSQTALMAKSANKPVVVCCETYKFTPRVQTDSFVYNELSDPDDLVKLGPGQASLLGGWRDQASLSLLNLVYDLTPATLVDSIITEISQIPPTSVPVVLRLHHLDMEEN